MDFHTKYVLFPAGKAANGTKAYKETSEDEKSVVNRHCNHLALKFSVCVKECQDRLPTTYWLPKLHKRPYKYDLLQTQVLASLLSKIMSLDTLRKFMKDQINICFGLLKILVRYLIN